MRGSLHYGGKGAAFGRDDAFLLLRSDDAGFCVSVGMTRSFSVGFLLTESGWCGVVGSGGDQIGDVFEGVNASPGSYSRAVQRSGGAGKFELSVE